jgi:CDP-6-deoxy-D-xylo-4-hexulose-3-dehydrase
MSEMDSTCYRVVGSLANSDRVVTDTFWVGVYPGMTDEMINDMAEIILRESARM